MAEQQEQRVAIRRPFTPTRAFQDLWEEMDRLWEGFPRFPHRRAAFTEPAWPALDVFEKNGSLVVKADIPGMTAKDIEVTLTEDGVTVSGQRSEEKEVKDKDYYRCERTYGSFMRQVPLPAGADRDKAQANFKDGVLEISFPLKEEAKQKKIEVKTT
jgi:HSP20 family protein